MESNFVNKVANSGLITINLNDFLPTDNQLCFFDLADFLFMKLVLKEKDFRENLKTFNWESYENKIVAVHCSEDVIIPNWAYSLLVVHFSSINCQFFLCEKNELKEIFALEMIKQIDLKKFEDQRIILKGCGDDSITSKMYFELTRKLLPVVKTLMYGEPCSTVPLYKKK